MRVLAWDVGLRTLSFCVIDMTTTVDASAAIDVNIVTWDSIDVQVDDDEEKAASGVGAGSKRVKTGAVSVEDGARLIMDTLHRRAAVLLEGVDAIVIEQQPAGGHNQQSNVRMKVMSHAIQCYFYTRYIVQGIMVPPSLSFVSASSKFSEMPKTAAVPAGDVDDNATAKTTTKTYGRNKKYAVAKTAELLARFLPANHGALKLFNSTSTKKKDDLADSFLLGYYFLLKATAPPPPPRKRAVRVKVKAEASPDDAAPAPKAKRARRRDDEAAATETDGTADATTAKPKRDRRPRVEQPAAREK
jgi:hypothetical protein